MEQITKYKGKGWILILMLAGFALILLLGLITPHASAAMFVYGSAPNYSAVVLPNESYVHQGQNISQGNYYYLRGVYGFSGQLAHWNNDDSVGYGKPDQIVTLTGGKGPTYIGPVSFPVGRWFQWDGDYCPLNSDSCSVGFGHGNAYVFAVVPPQQTDSEGILQERTVVQTNYITIFQNGSTTQIPVTYAQIETYYATPAPTTEAPLGSGTIMVTPTEIPEPTPMPILNPDIQDQNGIPIPGGVSGATVVTKKASGMVIVPVLAAMLLMIVRRKE
jgi:hypothetical protein